jgi:hypothetical protein
MPLKKYSYAILLLLSSVFTQAQNSKIFGSITDATDASSVIGAAVIITPISDTTQWKGTMTDEDGKFEFDALASGSYKLKVTYVGYKPFERNVRIENTDVNLGKLQLSQSAVALKELEVVEKQVRVEQKQDTTEYNANAYKVNRDANAEDLVTKMPGITSENGKVKAQGEELKKVTIDGKDFFGSDVTTALRNLPAEIVDRTQVFDRMSDQAQFTGFDDGNSQKSMNIITKPGMNNGIFGKVYAGYGYIDDSRYNAGANVNWFKNDRRLSLVLMSNNTNQQNFSAEDLAGVLSSTGGGGGGMRGGRRPGGGGGGSQNSFSIGQQSGISTTHAAGLNYIDTWGNLKKVKVTGSYFFNYTNNANASDLSRQYFNTNDSSNYYRESSESNSTNMNHRFNFRMQYDIDSMNSLIITPKFTTQQNIKNGLVLGQSTNAENARLSSTQSNNSAKTFAYNLSSEFLYRHKFNHKYRTLSVSVTPGVNNRMGNSDQLAISEYFADTSLIDQKTNSASDNYSVSGNISYTEQAGKTGMVQLSYDASYTWNNADKRTFNLDSVLSESLDTSLSNKYANEFMTHKLGASYRVNVKKASITAGVAGQYALLTGKNEFPLQYNTNRTFFNVLPNFMLNYKFSSAANIRVMYRASTNAPSISQLQSVIDNSNPLLLSTGNTALKQSVNHFAMTRFSFNNSKTAQSFFAFASFNYVQDYISNSTFIASTDTVLQGDVLQRAGSQITQPVNIDGNLSANSFFTYSIPITKIKCNLNLNAGFTYTRIPGLINLATNFSNTYNLNGGFVLSSNINEKIDFTISYMGNYNIVKNTLQTNSNNNYFTHNANARFNWLFWKGFVFNTSVQNTLYNGVSQGFNQNIFLWNASLGYKFLKDKSLELKVGVNDILNQNNGISRTVTDTYIEDNSNKVLKRYYLVTLTYNFRFANKKKG